MIREGTGCLAQDRPCSDKSLAEIYGAPLLFQADAPSCGNRSIAL
jgi:hypothetical protein